MRRIRTFGARLGIGAALAALMLSTFVAPVAASSHTRWVDNNTSSRGPAACANAHFSTIQGAINASNPGDKVYVCPGNYQQEITIDVPNLEVRSIPALGARIYAPATMTDLGDGITAEVNITAPNVMFVGFWLKFHDGDVITQPVKPSITTDCQEVTAAIWAQAPHATLKANHINTVGDNTLSGQCGYLDGIVLADDAEPVPGGGAWGPATSLVWRNWIINFKEAGILVEGDRSAKLWNNNIRYVHYNDPATCNLVPVVGVNPSLDFPCEEPPPISAPIVGPFDGVFPFPMGIWVEGSLVDARGNTIYSTIDTSVPEDIPQPSFLAVGINFAAATDGSKMRSNIVDNVFTGIGVSDDISFIPLPVQPKPPAPDGVAVNGNRVSESVFAFLVDGADSYYYANRAHLNIFGMYVADESTGNTFDHNDFRYNVEYDCADYSTGGTGDEGTDNYWFSAGPNLGFSQTPDGICFPFFDPI